MGSLLSIAAVITDTYIKFLGWAICAAIILIPFAMIYIALWLIDLRKQVHQLCTQKEHHLDLLQEANELLITKDRTIASLSGFANDRVEVRKGVAILTKDRANKESQITSLQTKMAAMKAKHAEEAEGLKEEIKDLREEVEAYAKDFQKLGLDTPTRGTKISSLGATKHEEVNKVVLLPCKPESDDSESGSQNSGDNSWNIL
ncbi:hypothetical protein K490DRAFT_69554 [Saccharata proteae CBS 121410]|uniref:Uncharacterized protein n=1 Tax=Saccharata proteae CBS 121410 TaxID=1314787 RepID=A0A9P4HNT6_9PEZI|nr:hypothetical protein K490DRAFT_69554 [Saccharata proteae CBS 121410]